MATMIKAYIGNQPVMVPKGVYVPGASPTPTGSVASTNAPMIDAYIGGVKVKVPKGARVPGASLSSQVESAPNKTAENKPDPPSSDMDWIKTLKYPDGTPLSKEHLIMLDFMDKHGQYIQDNPVMNEKETYALIEDMAKQAELDVGPYYDKIKYEDIDNLKRQMGHVRQAAAMYQQEEALSYKQKLQQSRERISASGGAWSGRAKEVLGKAGAQSTDIEGEIPQERRYGWERTNDQIQTQAENLGVAAEKRYGSGELAKVQDEFGNFANPYDLASGNVDYQEGRYSPLYSAKRIENGTPQAGYTRSGAQTQYATGPNRRFASTYDIERQAATERARNRYLQTRGYTPAG